MKLHLTDVKKKNNAFVFVENNNSRCVMLVARMKLKTLECSIN